MRSKLDTTVTAKLPAEIELTKRNSSNSLEIEVKTGSELLGRLLIGRGSIQWWPKGNKVNRSSMRWKQFAAVLNEYVGA
ncbi:MAG: hypothetical protein M3Y57_06280 [Acidobacteriota bacterium]|nr:hypothetical protein [Acidobacteriota bacterium]